MNRRVLIFVLFRLSLAFVPKQRNCFSIGTENLTYSMAGTVHKIMPQITFGSTSKSEDIRIAIVGGSMVNAAAVYYAGTAALKSGANLVYIITTDSAAPFVKQYSPDLIVYPILHEKLKNKIHSIIHSANVIIIGTGLEIENTGQTNLIMDVIDYCRKLRKPLIISEGAFFSITKNISHIKHYESPGIILAAPVEDIQLLSAVVRKEVPGIKKWYLYWGHHVSTLSGTDHFLSSVPSFNWNLPKLPRHRVVQGEGSVLCGILASLFAYSIKTNICVDIRKWQFLQSGSAYAASILTRSSNELAYKKYRTGMETKHMLFNIVLAFKKFGS